MSNATDQPSWKYRRKAIFGSMIFAGFVILWVMIRWDDTRLAETLVLGAFGLIGSAVAFYSGSAAYQDVRLWQRTGGYNSGSLVMHESIEVGEHDGHRPY